MDYITDQFNGTRVVPERNLSLPLNIIYQTKEKFTPFDICNGKLYRCKARVSLNIYREDDFSLIKKNEEKPFIAGMFGFSDKSMLSMARVDDEEKVYKINRDNLQIISEFDLGIISSSKTINCKDFYIIMFREERSRSFPIQVGRKNKHENQLVWGFKPEKGICGFSVTEDEKQLVVNDSHGGITLLDIESGEVLWSKNVDNIGVLTDDELDIKNKRGLGAAADYMHLYEGCIVCGYPFGYLIALDLQTGEVLWKRKTESERALLTVTENGLAYYIEDCFSSKSYKLVVVDCLSGVNSKEFDLELDQDIRELFGAVYSDVTTTHFWGASSRGLLYAINLETGKIDWHYDLKNGLPHVPFYICNNRLYIRTMTEDFIFEGKGGYILD